MAGDWGGEEKRNVCPQDPHLLIADAEFWLVYFDSRLHGNWTDQNMAFEEDVLSRALKADLNLAASCEFTLKSGQVVAVRVHLKERDTLAVLPTEYGKSLFTKCSFALRTINWICSLCNVGFSRCIELLHHKTTTFSCVSVFTEISSILQEQVRIPPSCFKIVCRFSENKDLHELITHTPPGKFHFALMESQFRGNIPLKSGQDFPCFADGENIKFWNGNGFPQTWILMHGICTFCFAHRLPLTFFPSYHLFYSIFVFHQSICYVRNEPAPQPLFCFFFFLPI